MESLMTIPDALPTVSVREYQKDTDDVADVIKDIKSDIKAYKDEAEKLCDMIVRCEQIREKIFKKIRQAEDLGLPKRQSFKIEDRLNRPYSMALFNLQ